MTRKEIGTPKIPAEMLPIPHMRPVTRLRSTTVSVVIGLPQMLPSHASAPSFTAAVLARMAAASARNSGEVKFWLMAPTCRAAAMIASFDPNSWTKSIPNHSEWIM